MIHDNQKKIANVIRVMQRDIKHNQDHIDKIENKDQFRINEDLGRKAQGKE